TCTDFSLAAYRGRPLRFRLAPPQAIGLAVSLYSAIGSEPPSVTNAPRWQAAAPDCAVPVVLLLSRWRMPPPSGIERAGVMRSPQRSRPTHVEVPAGSSVFAEPARPGGALWPRFVGGRWNRGRAGVE